MARLTDTQLLILSKAAARKDGLAVVPEGMTAANARKVGASLVARKLTREMKAKLGWPVWRDDGEGRNLTLVITRAGRDAIGVEDVTPVKVAPPKLAADARLRVAELEPKKATEPVTELRPRAGSKQALVIDMLQSKSGATLDAIIKATGWLPHTTRAVLTGLRKRGFAVERSKVDGTASVYRIVGQAVGRAA